MGLGALGASAGTADHLRLGVEVTGMVLGVGLGLVALRVARATPAPVKAKAGRAMEAEG